MAINKVVYGNTTLIDLTNDTVTENNLLSGAVAHGADGNTVNGAVITHDVIDNLTSTSTDDALSANQGSVLKGFVDTINLNMASKITNPSGTIIVGNQPAILHRKNDGSLEWLADSSTSPTWGSVSGKPFENIVETSMLNTKWSTLNHEWNLVVDGIRDLTTEGTATSTTCQKQQATIIEADNTQQIWIETLTRYVEVSGSKFMETSGNASTYTFTSEEITTDSVIKPKSSIVADKVSSITVTNGSCVVTFRNTASRTVRIYIQ